MDGFFITAREPDPGFTWKKLEGAEVVLFGAGQPLAMFKYACHKAGIDFAKLKVISPGGAGDMDKAFREGKGRYIQQQGPFPQQLEADGVGHIVAEVGPKIGPVAFSSLAAKREWLGSDMAKAFMRAYAKTRVYMLETPAKEIARAEKSYFPKIDEDVLARCIATYQKLGCWTPHVEITKPAFEVALDVFQHFGTLKLRRKHLVVLQDAQEHQAVQQRVRRLRRGQPELLGVHLFRLALALACLRRDPRPLQQALLQP
jgi:NitT/TauT family transport system substrate-binding protein